MNQRNHRNHSALITKKPFCELQDFVLLFSS